MSSRLCSLFLFVLMLAACDSSTGIPSENVRDFHMEFFEASSSESCPDPIASEAAALTSETAYSQTYRLHFIEGTDTSGSRIDLYWKARGDADSTFTFFASGTLEGSMAEDGALVYAGGTFQEDRDGASVSFRVEGRMNFRLNEEVQQSHEDYILVDSTDTGSYPIGCTYKLIYTGTLASSSDDA